MANIITGFRVLISIALLFCPVFSPVFYILYLTGGLSDMIDGTIGTIKYLEIPVCAVATFAAVQEGHFIRTDPDIK